MAVGRAFGYPPPPMTTAAIPMDRQSLWRDEFRATLALAWPLILTNITMVLINATDVFLLARLGRMRWRPQRLGRA